MSELTQPLGSHRQSFDMKRSVHSFLSTRYYFLVLLPIALLMFPNRGLIHDTRLYVFDILNIAHEGIFANDILTIVGTQDKYTLFSYIVAPLFKILSPWAATSIVLVVGQLIWFSGIIALVAKITEDEKATFYGLLSAFLLPSVYFGFSVLAYGEPFATPRIFVEGLTFWSLWCFFNRAYLISGLLVLTALTLHPIMGLVTAALISGVLLQEGRRWWWICGGTAAAGFAIVLASGALPLDRLTASLTGDWLYVVQTRAKYLYVSQWPVKDWSRIILSVSLIPPMIALYTGWQRRLMLSTLIVGGGGLVVSFIGTDVLHNVLLSQVQASRAIWFAYLMGTVGTGVVIANLYRRSEADGDVFLFLYVLAWAITHIFWPIPGMILGLIASALAYLRITQRIAGIPSLFRRLVYVMSTMFFMFLAFFRLKFWLLSYNRDRAFGESDGFSGIGGIAGVTHMEVIFVAAIVFVILRLRVKVPSYVTLALLLVLAVWSVVAWDRRSPEDRGMEGGYNADALVAQIPQGAQVYWEGNAKGSWLLLRRPSYFGNILGAGSVFSEALATEFLNRSRVIHALDGVDYVDVWHPTKPLDTISLRKRVFKRLTRADLITACTDAPELDFMVLSRPVDGAYLSVWHPRTAGQRASAPTAAPDLVPTQALFLYRCADFRSQS